MRIPGITSLSILLSLLFFELRCTPPVFLSTADIKTTIATLPKAWMEEPVIIFSDSTTIKLEIGTEGNRLIHTSTTVYYINKQNPDLLQTLTTKQNESYETVPELSCYVTYPDGTTWSGSDLLVTRYAVPTDKGYTSNQYYKVLSLPKYLEGMTVKVKIRRTYIKPEFYSFELAGEEMPVHERCMQLITPPDAHIIHEFSNNEKLAVDSSIVTGENGTTYTYLLHSIEKIDNAEMYPEPGTWFAALHVAAPPHGKDSYTWQQLGEYYLSQIASVYTGGDRLASFAENIRKTGPADSMVADILLLVRKKIRYHGNFDGIHAFIPHTVESIVQNGYGDCKDMAVLTQSVAKLAGVNVDLVLLNANGGFQAHDAVPTLGNFNHVIIRAHLANGRMIIADPTLTFGNPLETAFYFNGRKALFLLKNGCVFDTIPKAAGFYNTVATQSSITQNATDKRWMLSGNIMVGGLSAMYLYPDFKDLSPQEQAPLLREYLRNFFELDVDAASFDRLTADTVIMRYATSFQENYVSISGGGFVLNKPSVYGGDVRFTTLSYAGPRYYNEIVQRDTWTLPAHFSELEKQNLVSPVARGNWELRKNIAVRTFTQQKMCIGDDEGGSATAQKNKFLNATVWRK